MDDYLAIEPLLKAHLAGIAPGVGIHSLATLGDVKARMQLAPAIFIGYAGDRFDQDLTAQGVGLGQRWTQAWWTVIAVRAAGKTQGAALRATAGPLMADVMTLLGGWTPDSKTYRPFTRVAATQPLYHIGYAEFPLRWETRLNIRSAQ